jgi:hypothetical protein
MRIRGGGEGVIANPFLMAMGGITTPQTPTPREKINIDPPPLVVRGWIHL